jgi:hypothetical protein
MDGCKPPHITLFILAFIVVVFKPTVGIGVLFIENYQVIGVALYVGEIGW